MHWVTDQSPVTFSDHPVLQRWADLGDREAALRIDPGDPFFVDPKGRVDPRLTLYTTRSAYAHLARSTRENYADDCCVFFNFLWQHGKNWDEARAENLLDFEDWRRWSPRNPQRIGGSKWNRELAAMRRLYKWAVGKRYMAASPVVEREVMGRQGQMVSVPVARAKDARATNVKWLTPRAYRMWRDVGLRGYTADGRRDASFRGRHDDRNAAYSDVLFSSGMRRSEGGSLLTIEVPDLADNSRYFYDGKLGRETTKSKRERTVFYSAEALRAMNTYMCTSRRAAVRRAQAKGRYEAMQGLWIVTRRSGFEQRELHLVSEKGQVFERNITSLDVEERQRLYVEGKGGLEPLWLWLSEDGRPFLPHSWEAVFRAASERCRVLLEGKVSKPPYFTPHMARHSFALFMLATLQHALDTRFGLTPQERKDFRLLYGDSFRLVKNLLDHASEETTRAIYLAPVSDLQVRSLLLDEDSAGVTDLLAQIAKLSERVTDEVAS
ncbi:tyrosine-type recombinase/integrase [Streptomyces sp. B21-088]|uniref:tyrosine-type recombinase/integrase n=1 Tax=Streptomyces sp. B21-088 TaxID=3039411 RepID=UPI002FF0AB69